MHMTQDLLFIGPVQTTYLKNGKKQYVIELSHHGLHRHRVIKGDDREVVVRKAELQAAEWTSKWEQLEQRRRHEEQKGQKQEAAQQRTAEAQAAIDAIRNLLRDALRRDAVVDWDSLKDHSPFPERRPTQPRRPTAPHEPHPSDQAFLPRFSLLDHLLPARKRRKQEEANRRFRAAHQAWQEAMRNYNAALERQDAAYQAQLAGWRARKEEFLQKQEATNEAIDTLRTRYLSHDPEAIVEYCDQVLSRSPYPDCFPQEFDLAYNPSNRMLIADYVLPAPSDLPTLVEVKYVKSRDEFREVHMPERELNRLYDDAIYQVALRSVHELFTADQIEAITAIVFNGIVRTIDPRSGQNIEPCILSLQVQRDEFARINLAQVDPKECFKSLKGIGSSKLHSITPVAPIVQFDKEDSRFIEGRSVTAAVDESTNLAAMDWEDFEHLIRELFEREFAQTGGEVKVTQASRDGGVDAVVFDPDPIRGGKIVIQAKRYTNTVGVAAVRDLYGTVVNEGATKGILVTTADFGPDAYEFARGKPLTLINGANLLSLLEKHGHKARIDIQEAKAARLLQER